MGAAVVTPQGALRAVLVVMLVLVIQLTVGLDIRIVGAHPDFMVMLAIAVGLIGGPRRGAVAGFVVGMAADLFLPGPFGLSALVDTLIGFAAGNVPSRNDEGLWFVTPLAALTLSAVAVMLYAVLGALIGQDQMLHVDVGVIVAVVAIANTIVSVPMRRLVGWAFGHGGNERRRALVTGDRR